MSCHGDERCGRLFRHVEGASRSRELGAVEPFFDDHCHHTYYRCPTRESHFRCGRWNLSYSRRASKESANINQTSPDPLDESAPDAFPRAKWLRVLLTIIPPLTALCFALWYGSILVDDAFITFRYSENLAAGHGLVFNPGEPVLGTSSPLMAILLGLLKLIGVDVLLAARGIGLISVMAVVLICQQLAARPLGAIGAAAVAMCLALHPGLAFTANSGMETGLSMTAVYGTLLLTLRGHYLSAGFAGGAAFLLRPDGALVALIAIGVALLRAPRRAWQPLLATAVVALPWLVYAAVTYGGIVPHSVQAKQLIHPDTPLHILVSNLGHLGYGLGMKILGAFALVGLVFAALRRSEPLLVALWMLLYLAGLSASRIAANFPWYIGPLLPGLTLVAGYGLAGLANLFLTRVFKPANAARLEILRDASFVLLIAIALCFRDGVLRRFKHEGPYGPRVSAYLQIGELLRERCAPGDAVLVGEVGAMAYALPEQMILDSSGINSPAVYRARKADRDRSLAAGIADPPPEGTRAWVLEIVEQYQPRYIATHALFLHGRSIVTNPTIKAAYHRLALDMLDGSAYLVLERSENPSSRE